MEREIERFLKYVQSTTPLNNEGGVNYYYEKQEIDGSFEEIYKKWYPDPEVKVPELVSVNLKQFNKQLAVAFWSCFGWPGNEPKESKAQKEFISLLSEIYSLDNIQSYIEDDEGYGEICFSIKSGNYKHVYNIEWYPD